MTMQSDQRKPFQRLLEEHYLQQKIEASDLLQKAKSKAWDRFLKLELPTQKAEAFRYIHLRKLFEQSYEPSSQQLFNCTNIAPYIYPECSDSVLVFINGHFQPQLSQINGISKKVTISSLNDASRTYGTFLNNLWTKSNQEEQDAFAALNAALHSNGAFIYIPPKVVVETPIQILNIIDTDKQAMLISPRCHVFVGSQSQASFISSQGCCSGSSSFINQSIEFTVEEDAHVLYYQMANEMPKDFWFFDASRAYLKRNSTFKTICINEGASTIRHDYRVTLAGENCEASLNGIWMLSDKREAHTHILMDHQAPHCRSMQLYKGVLNDFTRSSFEGKILVKQAAQKTDAFQLNNNLLLSDHAHADSKPNLEIFADDVKASHGATVGQLNEEQLFYLKARGFAENEAKSILIYSFCKEVIDMCPIPSLYKSISKRAKLYLQKESSCHPQ